VHGSGLDLRGAAVSMSLPLKIGAEEYEAPAVCRISVASLTWWNIDELLQSLLVHPVSFILGISMILLLSQAGASKKARAGIAAGVPLHRHAGRKLRKLGHLAMIVT
jgi:hypothetical protein